MPEMVARQLPSETVPAPVLKTDRSTAGLRVGVIGGGIAGLASAHFLLKAGHVPVVFEATDQLGGLGTYFVHDGVFLERFYHVILDSDADLCALIADLGVNDRLVW